MTLSPRRLPAPSGTSPASSARTRCRSEDRAGIVRPDDGDRPRRARGVVRCAGRAAISISTTTKRASTSTASSPGSRSPIGRVGRRRTITRRSWETAGVQLGLYRGGELIGCARAITDFARFAYLSDVYVEPGYRGQGLGRWLVQVMLDHPELQNVRWVLHTNDAHGLYGQFGFEAADETVMQRARPALA